MLDDYQEKAAGLDVQMHEDQLGRLMYCGLGLTGEAGEVADIIKKLYTAAGDGSETSFNLAAIRDELGDVLWYLSQLCTELHMTLDEVATANLDKLRKRHGEPIE